MGGGDSRMAKKVKKAIVNWSTYSGLLVLLLGLAFSATLVLRDKSTDISSGAVYVTPTPPPQEPCDWDCLPGSYTCQYPRSGTCVSPKKCCEDPWGTLTVTKCKPPAGQNKCWVYFHWEARNVTDEIHIWGNAGEFDYITRLKSGNMRQFMNLGIHTVSIEAMEEG